MLKDFADVHPERFINVTNGITPRRFLALSNPGLARLLTESIGEGWLTDLDRLRRLAPLADDAGFRDRFRAVKNGNKQALAKWLRDTSGLDVDPTSLFDAQCKRFHEYKRQHLAILHVVSLHDRIQSGDLDGLVPRTFVFAGKAAPGYRMAKLIIRLIHGVAQTIDRDPVARKLLRVVFVPDFNVKNAQHIYPAADLSEQISTAGMEASGTGNMKFALNGALTIGTLDGANVEIRDAVGAKNFFLFGMTTEEVAALRASGYRPRDVVAGDAELARALDAVTRGVYSDGDPALFEPLIRSLVDKDPFFVLADFRAYVECQKEVARAWRDPERWTRTAIENVAGMGTFSSDRSIAEYARNVWKVEPVKVPAPKR